MLMPKRTKWRRQQRGRIRGEATRGNTVAFGEFGLQAIEHTLDHGTDLEAIGDGYVSVTPLQLDLTHHASLGELGERYG